MTETILNISLDTLLSLKNFWRFSTGIREGKGWTPE